MGGAAEGNPLTAIIGDALRERLARVERRQDSEPVRIPTVAGDGVQPGVDLDDSAGLLDLMETRDGAG